MMQRRRSTRVVRRPVNRDCYFCENKTLPAYKDTAILGKYLTERGKILAASKTGICSKHQRVLTKAIKHARSVALLPFVVRA